MAFLTPEAIEDIKSLLEKYKFADKTKASLTKDIAEFIESIILELQESMQLAIDDIVEEVRSESINEGICNQIEHDELFALNTLEEYNNKPYLLLCNTKDKKYICKMIDNKLYLYDNNKSAISGITIDIETVLQYKPIANVDNVSYLLSPVLNIEC